MVDRIEAIRNKKRYEQNIKGAALIHPSDMPQHLIDGLANFIHDQRRKIQNIDEILKGN